MKTEKKFRVDSFDDIRKRLKDLGSEPRDCRMTIHHYGSCEGNNVVKAVVYSDRTEIHKLTEKDGTFELSETIAMDSEEAALNWLKENALEPVKTMEMCDQNYELDNATVGLYVIDEDMLSVIVTCDDDQEKELVEKLGLKDAERINKPFNLCVS